MATSSSSTCASAQLRASHLRTRVLVDLTELREQPLPGFTVHFDDADTTKLCLIVTPTEGHFAGLRLHFDVEVPLEFPLAPVNISNSTKLDHPNVIDKRICLDTYVNEWQLPCYRRYGRYQHNNGTTPDYSLQGIFHQVASLFDTDSDIVPHPQWDGGYSKLSPESALERRHEAVKGLHNFHCSRCLFPLTPVTELKNEPKAMANWSKPDACRTDGQPATEDAPFAPSTSSSPVIATPATVVEGISSVSDDVQAERCHLERIDADALLHLLAFLNTTELLSFAAAYPFAAELSTSTNIIAARNIRCFVTKQTTGQTLLGIGVVWNDELKRLESSSDWLSREAWTDLEVREDARGNWYSHWLPMAIHDDHFLRARKEIVTRLKEIEQRPRHTLSQYKRSVVKHEPSVDGYRELCRFANDIIVRFMKTTERLVELFRPPPDVRTYDWCLGCDNINCPGWKSKPVAQPPFDKLMHLSEKALCDFVAVVHLAASLAATNPAIVNDATTSVHRFIRHTDARRKEQTPDLGELLIQLMFCPDIGWTDLRGPLLQESFTRQVVWMLDGRRGRGQLALALLENEPVSEWRLKTSFEASRISLRLIMFQHAFLSQIPTLCGKRPGERLTLVELKKGLDARYGLPPSDMPGRLVQQIKEIYAVDNYASFSTRLGLRSPSKQWMTQYLRDRVNESLSSGYHRVPVTHDVLLNARLVHDWEWGNRTPERRRIRGAVRTRIEEITKSFFPGKR